MNDIIKKDDLRASIQSKIYVIRGQRVMLDFDLAAMNSHRDDSHRDWHLGVTSSCRDLVQ